MNTDELIEQLHNTNAEKRATERRLTAMRKAWWLAVPAAAAVALLLLLPQHGKAEPKQVTGLHVYCNNSCEQEDALTIIQQNIDNIRSTVME